MKTSIKTTVGKANAIIQSIDALGSRDLHQMVRLSPRGAYWLARARTTLDSIVSPARTAFSTARDVAISKAEGKPLSPEAEKELHAMDMELSDTKVEVEITTIDISEINGEGDGRMINILGVLSEFLITDKSADSPAAS